MNLIQKAHLHKYGIGFNSMKEANCVKPHKAKETWQHFLLKCAICYQLNKEGKEFFTEVPIRGGKIPDIINVTDDLCYELETKAKKTTWWRDEQSEFNFVELPVMDTLNFIFKNGIKNRKRRKI